MKRLLLLALVAALPGCATLQRLNCSENFQPTDWSALGRQVSAAKATWQAANVADYRFDVLNTGYVFPTAWSVEVRRRAVARVVITLPGPPSDVPPERLGEFDTLDGLFEALEREVASRGGGRACAAVRATFDAALGYPTEVVRGDYDQRLADGVGGYRVSNFSVPPASN